MPTRSELIAYDRSEEEIRLELGVDNLVFQELDHMLRDVLSFNSMLDGLEASCFNGTTLLEEVIKVTFLVNENL